MNNPRGLPTLSFHVDTSRGGLPVSVCACGVWLIRDEIAWQHIDSCPFPDPAYGSVTVESPA